MIVKAPAALVEIVRTLFTRTNRLLLMSSVLLIITFDWLAESGHEILNWVFRRWSEAKFHRPQGAFPWFELTYILFAIIAFLFARSCYKRLSVDSRLILEARSDDCDALVVFVSKSNNRDEITETIEIERIEDQSASNNCALLNSAWRSQFQTHLQVLLEALAFHFDGRAGKRKPKRITLVASRQSIGIARRLKATLPTLLARCGQDVTVLSIESVGTGLWADGVDYFNSDQILDAIEAIYFDHAKNGVHPRELIIDVTGGTTLTSIISSMVCLKMGGRIEYISRDLRVKVFNPVYADPIEHV